MEYQFRAIEPETLKRLRHLDDAGRPPRPYLDVEGGSPMRCCLGRARPAEEIVLAAYAPLRGWAAQTGADPGPYEELGPVYIHAEPCSEPAPGYPAALGGPLRVFRAYTAQGDIHGGRLLADGLSADPDAALAVLDELFADPEVALVHARAVEFGCFLYEVRRS
ncbi:hypothetical protein FHR32_003486 [Streptosporangium album]|uniref:DUF1203 domain-containing protein n=1 Tax=Streptosporangium album TaxID=47479 RepID=A0A7W7W9R4_9ACTN|nr:DUF1203 domain-containing protein [Streptosporangium album]MBB4939181.1 hypothetical protein [Streptosporangium album]